MQETKNIPTPWGPFGYLTYKRTYSRRVDDNKTEEFPQTIHRVIEACNSQLGCEFSDAQREELREIFQRLKCSVAGRFLWQLGTKTVGKYGLLSLQNCAGTIVNDPIAPFTWTMDALMLGVGVGYNIQREYIHEIPRPHHADVIRQDTDDADFIVPDSREGWVELLRKTLEAHYGKGKGFTYSTILVRSEGAPIKGFGGVASGPEKLCWGIGKISEILNRRAGKKVRPIDCLDIMNLIGDIVVAGNVRRSAQIALGDMDDLQYLNAKSWDNLARYNWRRMSNNSVICNDISLLPDQFWEGYLGGGEPYGLINLGLSQDCGRIGERQYPDKGVTVFNPCAEQPLEDKETCSLAEIFLPMIDDKEELWKGVQYLYIIVKHSLNLPCHQEETEAVVHRNQRMGIGITGFLQASKEQKSWLPDTYKRLRQFDIEYSRSRGWPISIKLTTVKPSGTLSLLPLVTPGCHPGIFQYFIRRITMASSSPLVALCKSQGYKTEFLKKRDGSLDTGSILVEFPCKYPLGTPLAEDMNAIDQLETVKWLQTNWSDNAVSCTVYYYKHELPEIQDWLAKNYNDNVKSISFLLHEEHGFEQAPYEKISAARYEDMVKKVKPITSVAAVAEDTFELDECNTGACPVK